MNRFVWIAIGLGVGCNAVLGIEAGELAADGPGGAAAGAAGTGASGTAGAGMGGGGQAGSGTVGPCPTIAVPDDCVAGHVDSPDACCAPGRSCQGGDCSDGECGPVDLAAVGEEAIEIVVVGDRVLWSTGYGSTVKSANHDGSDAVELFPPLVIHYVTQIATDGVHVYFTDYDTGVIRRVAVGGGPVEQVSDAAPGVEPPLKARFGRIAVSADHVYWAMEDLGVYRAHKDGSTPAAVLVAEDAALGIAVDATHVYWGDRVGERIRRLTHEGAESGATPEDIVVGTPYPSDLVLDDERVYWLGGLGLSTALKSGVNQGLLTLYATIGYGEHLAVDDVFAFWSDTGNDTFNRIRKDGLGPKTTLFTSGLADRGPVALSCETIFFADNSALRKIAK